MAAPTGSVSSPATDHCRATLAVFGVALLVRAVALGIAASDPGFTALRFDEADYFALAGIIPDPLEGRFADVMSPGYTLLLRWLPDSREHGVLVAAAVNLLLGAFTQLFTFRIARRFASLRMAIAATCLAALLGPTIFYELRPLPDSLSAFAVVACADLWLGSSQNAKARGASLRALGCGALAVLATMARGTSALLVFSAVDLFRKPRLLLWFVAGAALLIALHRGSPTATSFAVNLYVGNGPSADGTWKTPSDFDVRGSSPRELFAAASRAAETASGRPLKRSEVNRYYLEKTAQEALRRPFRALGLFAKKAWLAIGRREIPDNRDYAFERRYHSLLRSPLVFDPSLLIALGLPGLFLLAFSERRIVLLCGVLLPLVTLVGFYGVGRYRITWFPWLAIGAAHALTRFEVAWRARAVPRLLELAGASLAVFVASLASGPEPPTATNHFLRAYDLHAAGHPELALDEYDRAYVLAASAGEASVAAQINWNRTRAAAAARARAAQAQPVER